MKPRGFLGAIAALLLAPVVISLALVAPAYADGVQKRGKVAAAEQPADSPAFRTGWWLGIAAETQNTSFVGIVNDLAYAPQGGFDWVVPNTNFVLGLMGKVSFPHGSIVSDELGLDYNWSVLARFGVLLSPSTLVYGVAGTTQPQGIPDDFVDPGILNSFGAGLETMLTKNWTLAVDWTRVNLQTEGMPLVATQDTIGLVLRYRF